MLPWLSWHLCWCTVWIWSVKLFRAAFFAMSTVWVGAANALGGRSPIYISIYHCLHWCSSLASMCGVTGFSRGVGLARLDSREACELVIARLNGCLLQGWWVEVVYMYVNWFQLSSDEWRSSWVNLSLSLSLSPIHTHGFMVFTSHSSVFLQCGAYAY